MSFIRHQIEGLRGRLRQWLDRSPFALLATLALQRLLHNRDADQDKVGSGAAVLFGLLALPGALVAVMLFEKYGGIFHYMYGISRFDTFGESLRDEYFFIAFGMSVCAAIAVWKWDLIFPEARDYMVLVPLPISSRLLFLANVVAIAAFAGAFALDVNAVSGVLFPWVVCAAVPKFRFFLVFGFAHGLAVLLASLFSFLAVFAIVGCLMAILPEALFRRVSVLVRSALLTGVLSLMFSIVLVPAKLRHLETAPGLLWDPAVWFLGVCQVARRQNFGLWPEAARFGVIALGAAVAIGCLAYALAYRRYFLRIPERVEVIAVSRGALARVASRWADRWLLRTAFQRACYRFTFKTLARSDTHRLLATSFTILGAMVGTGIALLASAGKAGTPMVPGATVLAAPLLLALGLLVGLRLAFDVPTNLGAKWIFQLTLATTDHECVPVARKLMLTFIVPLAWLLVLPLYTALWSWRVGLLEASVMTATAALTADVLLLKFRKIPFTCPPPSFGQNFIARILVIALLFALSITIIVQLELWILREPLAILAMGAVFLGGWIGVARYREEQPQPDRELQFDNAQQGAFELLNLSGR